MTELQAICDFLGEFAPPHLAEDWDNVGLLVGDPKKEVSRVRNLMAAGLTFPLQLAAEADAKYAGKGIHQDEAEKPIFWYKPEDAGKYRVVLANLSVVEAVEPPQIEDVQTFAK